MRRLKRALYRWAGNAAMLAAFPFFVLDKLFEKLSAVVTILCAIIVAPNVIFYEWCIKRHNALWKSGDPHP